MNILGWTDEEIAKGVAADLAGARVVNLGIGLPTLVARYLESDQVLVHSENGIVGIGPPATAGQEDWDAIDPGKSPVTLVAGAAILDHVDSFTLIRGGRLDVAVLGAYQISARGDLASWMIPGRPTGSVGGSMDLAVGARKRWVMARHFDKGGRPKIVRECTYPLTAPRCVNRVYTNLGVFDITPDGVDMVKLAPGVREEDLELPANVIVRADARGSGGA